MHESGYDAVDGSSTRHVSAMDMGATKAPMIFGGATYPWCAEWDRGLRRLFASYSAAKQRQNVLDYDDLLLYWAEMMGDPDVAAEIGGRFDHILVDEYQDTNRLQSKILLRLNPEGRGLMVVGDDAQSIYSFRAATVRNILDFPHEFRPASENGESARPRSTGDTARPRRRGH